MHKGSKNRHQAGLSTVKAVGALSGIMILFLIIFLLTLNGGNDNKDNNSNNNTDNQNASTDSDGSSYIRIPTNSLIYSSETYKFSFAYPNSFQQLSDTSSGSSTLVSRAESALANNKPIGNSGALLNGQFGAYVYRKTDFKILTGDPNVFAAATKTNNTLAWTITESDAPGTPPKIGDKYSPQSITSQTGAKTYIFPLYTNGTLLGRIVFEAGDYYVLVALPYISKPGLDTLTAADVAAYNVIIENIAKTVRVTATATQSTDTDSTD